MLERRRKTLDEEIYVTGTRACAQFERRSAEAGVADRAGVAGRNGCN